MPAAARPTVSVYSADDDTQVVENVALPGVFSAPMRQDIVHFVHTNMSKNKRQAYAVRTETGMDYSAESWGTGRAMSRIPRVSGSGTGAASSGAFGNMCRNGRMFAPTRVWRKWHRRVNQNQRRYAVASALAASAIPALVQARGHRISNVPEVPLVISGLESVSKTSQANKILARFGISEDIAKAEKSKKVRAGAGKMRNRRYVSRRGPLFVYADNSSALAKAVRNLTGVDVCHVDRLNLLQLAPGGHLGRFVVFSDTAFKKLDTIYANKTGFTLPNHIVSNGDLSRVINSDEVQKALKPAKTVRTKTARKKNPLKNLGVMVKLNPYTLASRRAELRRQAQKKKKVAGKRNGNTRAQRMANYSNFYK